MESPVQPETVFITKYALTDGVREVPVVKLDPDGYAYVKLKGSPSYGTLMGKKDWHLTKAEALARAEEMRIAKIGSHQKSIAKLEKLDLTQVRDAR